MGDMIFFEVCFPDMVNSLTKFFVSSPHLRRWTRYNLLFNYASGSLSLSRCCRGLTWRRRHAAAKSLAIEGDCAERRGVLVVAQDLVDLLYIQPFP